MRELKFQWRLPQGGERPGGLPDVEAQLAFCRAAEEAFSLNVVAGHTPDEQHGYGDWLEHDERYDAGVELGVRMSVIARETRAEAHRAARALIDEPRPFDHRGAESSFAEDVAEGIHEYSRAGVTQFILSGWPKLEEMQFFGREVWPLVMGSRAFTPAACGSSSSKCSS